MQRTATLGGKKECRETTEHKDIIKIASDSTYSKYTKDHSKSLTRKPLNVIVTICT